MMPPKKTDKTKPKLNTPGPRGGNPQKHPTSNRDVQTPPTTRFQEKKNSVVNEIDAWLLVGLIKRKGQPFLAMLSPAIDPPTALSELIHQVVLDLEEMISMQFILHPERPVLRIRYSLHVESPRSPQKTVPPEPVSGMPPSPDIKSLGDMITNLAILRAKALAEYMDGFKDIPSERMEREVMRRSLASALSSALVNQRHASTCSERLKFIRYRFECRLIRNERRETLAEVKLTAKNLQTVLKEEFGAEIDLSKVDLHKLARDLTPIRAGEVEVRFKAASSLPELEENLDDADSGQTSGAPAPQHDNQRETEKLVQSIEELHEISRDLLKIATQSVRINEMLAAIAEKDFPSFEMLQSTVHAIQKILDCGKHELVNVRDEFVNTIDKKTNRRHRVLKFKAGTPLTITAKSPNLDSPNGRVGLKDRSGNDPTYLLKVKLVLLRLQPLSSP